MKLQICQKSVRPESPNLHARTMNQIQNLLPPNFFG